MRTGLSPTSHHTHASPPIDWQAVHCKRFSITTMRSRNDMPHFCAERTEGVRNLQQ